VPAKFKCGHSSRRAFSSSLGVCIDEVKVDIFLKTENCEVKYYCCWFHIKNCEKESIKWLGSPMQYPACPDNMTKRIPWCSFTCWAFVWDELISQESRTER
jgi:hypothetical protein